MDQAAESRVASQASSLIPSGTVTFLFTDVEGSTERWERHRETMKAALARHDAVLNAAIAANGGYIFKKMGDAYCAAFRTAPEAVRASVDSQQALSKEDFKAVDGLNVRMSIHTGYADERERDYFGPSVNRVARLLSIGHGGQILVSAAASDLVQGELPAQVTMRALGAHRLKDLAHPEQVFQLVAAGLPADFPPLRSLDSLPNNLPLQVTSFIGRDEDVSEVKSGLEKTRLLTLTGSGGVGKTRLALQVGAEVLDQHPDGVWLVDLAGLQDADLVVSEVASVLGVRVGADRSLADSIVYALKPKRACVILDNCEHLVAAAAQVASTIIKGAPQVKVLATSREALGIAGERVYRVNSLAVPSQKDEVTADNATRFPALQLFIDRATAVNSHFALNDSDAHIVGDICRSLDGIPFAIELAAARTNVMTVTNLAERLKERFRILTSGDRTALPRQQTMRALVDWSYNLLNEREKTVLNRTAVFAGGFSLEAASEICSDASIEAWEMLDILSSLVLKSLVVAELSGTTERYRLLESTWQYAREKLEETGEGESVNRKHAMYYLRVAEAGDRSWDVTPRTVWTAALEPELDNFRAALGWTLTKQRDISLGASLAAALRELWYQVGSSVEGYRWNQLALQLLGDRSADTTTVKLLLCYSSTEELELDQIERALGLARRLGDVGLLAEAQLLLGFAYDRKGRLDEAEAAYTKAVPLLQQTGKKRQLATCYSWWAITHFVRGNAEAARSGFNEALILSRSLADEHQSATVLGNLAELAFAEGDAEKAAASAYDVLAIRRKGKDTISLVNALINVTAYELARGNFQAVREHSREALRVGRAQAIVLVAYTIQHRAVVGAREGQPELAARLLGFVDVIVKKHELAREPTEKWSYEQLLAALRGHLSDDEIAALGAEGAAWSEDQAIEEALKI